MTTKSYAADPGGRFTSDAHRRVLGFLSHPDDDYGWTCAALFARMTPDIGTDFQSTDELQEILDELVEDGHAEEIRTGEEGVAGIVYRQTQDGFDVLNGPIANEPPPGAEVAGPAMITTTAAAGGATKI